jgi:predicted RNA-binding Zn ribbon-like protein
MFQRPEDPVRLAVDLVNSWDALETHNPELMRDVATLKRFLARRGFAGGARATTKDLVRVRELRDSLRAAFSAGDERAAVARLNQTLGKSSARPQFEQTPESWSLVWVGPLIDALAATTAMSLLEAIRLDGWERFGLCAGSPCCCVFVDRSKNRSRRFCSDLCADRVAQSLHRTRRAAQSRKSRR